MTLNNISKKVKNLFKDIIYKIFISLIFIVVLLGIYTLANRQRIGAECRDNWTSFSIGSGTCSHHGGVSFWEYKYWWNKHKVLYRVSSNPITGEQCDYGYNIHIEACCDDDDYSCEIYDKAPIGATAFCNDGTYDFNQNMENNCIDNGGVEMDSQYSPFVSN